MQLARPALAAVLAGFIDNGVHIVAVDLSDRLVGPGLGQPGRDDFRLDDGRVAAERSGGPRVAVSPATPRSFCSALRRGLVIDEKLADAGAEAVGGAVGVSGLLAQLLGLVLGNHGLCAGACDRSGRRAALRACPSVSAAPGTGSSLVSLSARLTEPRVNLALRPSGRRKRIAQLIRPEGWIIKHKPLGPAVGSLAAFGLRVEFSDGRDSENGHGGLRGNGRVTAGGRYAALPIVTYIGLLTPENYGFGG